MHGWVINFGGPGLSHTKYSVNKLLQVLYTLTVLL